MKQNNTKSKKITLTKGEHLTFPHRLAKTKSESKKNLDLLFALQRLAYPEIDKGIRMNKKIVRIIRPHTSVKKKA